MKKVLIIASSLRKQGNSDVLADCFAKGVKSVGHQVEKVYLKDKKIGFCTGCLACQKDGFCSIKDDMPQILEKMKHSDVLVFATPIYFYEMCGQMKTFLDRTNPLYDTDYEFQDIYLIASAAEEETSAMDGAIKGLQGWIDCFPRTSLKGVLYGIGLTGTQDIIKHSALMQDAMVMGSKI